LTVIGLPPNSTVSLDPIYLLSGFRDINNNLLSPGTLLGSTDALGNFTYSFFRGLGESADIELIWNITGPLSRSGKVQFTSPDVCPQFEDCTPLPPSPPIPTLGEWGIISLALLLMIVGVARIKEMEQDSIQNIVK